MNVDDVLEADWDAVGQLRDPVLVVALRGYFDIAGAATSALEWCLDDREVTVVASIDPDPFFDFTSQRPEVYLDEDEQRKIIWPENEIVVVRFPDGARDLVVLSGIEPHFNWNIFAECIVQGAQRLNCSIAVTIGAFDESIPHTRTPNVFGSTSNAALARRMKLSLPKYEGPTGLVGVLHERFEREHLPSVSLRVGVPRYLLNAQHPKSSAALLRHLELVLGVPTRHAELYEEIRRWSELHDAAVEGDEQISNYVQVLERDFDQRSQVQLPSAEDLGAELEQFLREQPDEDSDK
ncbi:MAG: PAC2 family protein [Actinobacteria bacterium]|nr:MAG: PAC2 family protein [Actinomycetota bacterium]